MGSGKKQTIGYKYFMGMHMVICHGPVDKISRIDVGERVAWSGSVTANGSISINQPDLFGGEQKEGGIVGTLDVAMGASDQTPNAYLMSQLGTIMPAFRGVVSIILRKMYLCAMSPYPKPWAFLVTRVPKSWYPAKAIIDASNPLGGSANAAHIIYETLTHPDWGMGYSESALDLATFQAMADTLYSEGLGLSFTLSNTDSIESFIYSVLTHVNGMMYTDPVTGKFAVSLLRYDYDVNTLPLFNEANIVSLDSYERPAFGEMVNEIVVSYRPKGSADDATVTLQDLASVQAQEGVISQTVNYPGIDNADNAARIALRDVRQKSTPLARVKIRVNRSAWNITIGKCYRFSWAEHSVVSLVVRVLSINYGDLNDPTIIVDGVEDVFGLPLATYLQEQPSLWTNPVQPPGSVTPRKVYEATYWDLNRALDPANFDALPTTATFLSAAGGAPTYAAQNYELWTHPGSSAFIKADSEEFCPHGVLQTNIGKTNTAFTITIKGGDFTNFSVGGYCIIDNEILRVDSINQTTGDMTVGRGCLDTVPATHTAGAAVLFAMGYVSADPTEYVAGETVQAKLLSRTPTGLLALSGAPTDSVVTVGRQSKPYPPGNLRINGLSYPLSVDDVIVVTWAHRDRTQQLATIVDHTTGNIGPELGVTYSARILKASDNSVLASVANLTTTSWSPPVYAQGNYTVEVWSVRAGNQSFQRASHTFALALAIGAGWDYNWDANWGLGPAQAKKVTFTLSGAVDVGAGVRVTLGGVNFNYTEVSGDTLTSIASAVSALIDANGDYVSVAAGNTFQVTGPLRSDFTIATLITATSGTLNASRFDDQIAAPARAGNRQVMFFNWNGSPSTKPISYNMVIRKSNAVEGQPDTVFFNARKTSFIGDMITGADVNQQLMTLGSDAGVPGDHGINYLANEAGVDIYCMERSSVWPDDWCAGWDTAPIFFNAAIVFPVGEPADFRYNLGMPVSPPQKPGTWQTYAYTSPGDTTKPTTDPNYYFDKNITFLFGKADGFEDYVPVARPTISLLRYNRELAAGLDVFAVVDGITYRYKPTGGDDTLATLTALAAKVNAKVADYNSLNFARVLTLNNGDQFLVSFDNNQNPKAVYRSSADDGATFTTSRYANAVMCGLAGVYYWDAKFGTTQFSILQNLAAGLRQVITLEDGAEPVITDRFATWPQVVGSGGVGVNVAAGCADGSTFYVIGRRANNSQTAKAMYLYTTTDGKNLTEVGALSVSGSDPNAVSIDATGGFNAAFFVPGELAEVQSLLFKSGSRWFLKSGFGYSLYYTDDAVPQANWKRCPVGLNEANTGTSQNQLVSVVASGGKVFANNRNVLGNCVSYSTDNGSTWTALQPSGLSTEAPLWLYIVGGNVVGPVYSSSSKFVKATLAAPGTWAAATATGFANGSEASTNTSYQNYGSGLLAITPAGKVLYSADGLAYSESSISRDVDLAGTNSVVATVDTTRVGLLLTGQPNVPFTASGYSTGNNTTAITYNVDQPAY